MSVVQRAGLTAKRNLDQALITMGEQSKRMSVPLPERFVWLSVQILALKVLIDGHGIQDIRVEDSVRAVLTALDELVMASEGEVRSVLDNQVRLELRAVLGLIALARTHLPGSAGEAARQRLAPIAKPGKGPWS